MKRKERQAEYERLKREAPVLVRCKACDQLGPKRHMDPHHPFGRAGDNLLNFVWIHRHCHNLTHDNPATAKRAGLLGFDGSIEKRYHDT